MHDDELGDGGDDQVESGALTLPKPAELLALDGVSAALFATLRRWFGVGETVILDLAEIDSAVGQLGDPVMIAAMAMRKLQALHLIATPGVLTSTDVVIAIVNDLDRALIQAPSMYLGRRAEETDWDHALASIDEMDVSRAPLAADETDPEIEQFQVHHAALHEAVHALVAAGDGEIRYFM